MNPHDDAFERWLRTQLQAEPEPADDGFAARVLAALPPQIPPPRPVRRGSTQAAARAAALWALAVVMALLGLLAAQSAAQSATEAAAVAEAGEQALAGLALLALLVGWSLPQWRLNPWR